MRTLVSIAVRSYPGDTARYWAASIDEPLNDDFVTSQPEKIWTYGAGGWEEIYDLTPGVHTITVGVDTPPEKPWLVQVWINDQSLTEGQFIPVWKGNFLQLNFNVTGDVPYLTAQMPIYYFAVNPLTNYCQLIKPFEIPFVVDFAGGCPSIIEQTGSALKALGALPIITYHYEWFINPNAGEQFTPETWFWTNNGQGAPPGARSIFWWGFTARGYTTRAETSHIWPEPRRGADLCMEVYWVPLLPPWYLISTLPTDETATFMVGHVENDTAPREQWQYVVDHSVVFPIGQYGSTVCRLPPPSNPRIRIRSLQALPIVPIDNFRPGRFNLVIAEVENIGTYGVALPFICLKEYAPGFHSIYRGNIDFSPTAIGVGQTATLYLLFRLNETIVRQGFFTVQAGHFEGKIAGTVMAPMSRVVDEEKQVPLLQPTPMASIRSLSLSHTAPARAAKILSLTLSHKITAAKIQTLTLSHITPPPPPPPPAGYSFGGKVLSLLGPVVDAEVLLDGFSAKTGRDGSFYITDIPEGTYTLTVKPTRILDKLLLKSLSQKIDMYMNTSKIINLPINWMNIAIGTGATATIATVISKRKPKPPPTW
jgi:hypothetical protein